MQKEKQRKSIIQFFVQKWKSNVQFSHSLQLERLLLLSWQYLKFSLASLLITIKIDSYSICIIAFFPSMFFKKKRSASQAVDQKQQCQASPLPKLQQLIKLESDLISILGKRNLTLDEQADIFTRLEDMYLHALQGTTLGMEMLEKSLRIIGEFDSPARVRFLYFYAHEMKLKGAAGDEVEPVLLEAFHSNLSLRNKVDVGFKAALTFCQICQHSAEVDKILSNLIVTLEQELGYKPQKKVKIQSSNTHSNSQITKAIYLGSKISHKSLVKPVQTQGKIYKLQLYKYLFQAFISGQWKIQSEAKRKYYADCRVELKSRLIREYPGREIEKKLNYIEENRFVTLMEFNRLFRSDCNRETRNLSQNRSTSKPKSELPQDKVHHRSKSQISLRNGCQSVKSSFCKDTQEKKVVAVQSSTWSSSSKTSGFKLQLRKKSKNKLVSKEPSENRAAAEATPQQTHPEVAKLVFKEIPQNTKEIVLKFDKLQHDPKFDVKKKKLRHTFNWEKERHPKENHLQQAYNILCLPQIKQEASRDLSPHADTTNEEPKIQAVPEKIEETEQAHQSTDLNSARRIDLILKEGVEWMAHFENEEEHNHSSKPVASNTNFSECEAIHQQDPKPEQSFSDTHLIPEELSEQNLDRSYKIVIQSLEKPEINLIISQEVQDYLTRTNEKVIEKEVSRLGERQSKISQRLKKAICMKQCQISVEIKKAVQISLLDCSKSLEVDIANQSSPLISETKTISEQIQPFQIVAPIEEIQSFDSIINSQFSQNLIEVKGKAEKELKQYLTTHSYCNQQQKIISEWLEDLEEVLTSQIALESWNALFNTEIQSFLLALSTQIQKLCCLTTPVKPLPLKHQCSINQNNMEEFSSEESQPLPNHSDSFDDKDLDSEISSNSGKVNRPLHRSIHENINEPLQSENRPYFLAAPFIAEEDRRDNVSHFTCSHFAGSKIDTDKDSDFQWRSQMNFMNEIFKNDRIAENDLGTLQIPEQSSNSHREKRRQETQNIRSDEYSEISSESKVHRSRTQSEISNKTNIKTPSVTSRTQKKEKSHVCLSICYDDNYDSVTQSSKKFTHWLCPELKVRKNKLTFSIISRDREYQKEIMIPSFIMINDDSLREISAKVEGFLLKYPTNSELTTEQWQAIKKDVDRIDLLPDQTEIKPFTVFDKDTLEEDEIRCTVNLKLNRILLESHILELKTHPIHANSRQELEEILNNLDTHKMSIRNGELLIKDVWSFSGQRNIKLREKSQNIIHHFTFDILEQIGQNHTFNYCIKQQHGDSFKIEGIDQSKRGKIVKNMDTIIGFVLKVVNEKIHFNTQSLNQFLSIL